MDLQLFGQKYSQMLIFLTPRHIFNQPHGHFVTKRQTPFIDILAVCKTGARCVPFVNKLRI